VLQRHVFRKRRVSLKRVSLSTKQNKTKQNARVVKARAGKENLHKSSGRAGAPDINACARMHSRALLQLIYFSGIVPIGPELTPVAESGANACPGEAAQRCENASAGTALEDAYASGTAADGFPRVRKCAAEPAAAAEGDARAGASTAVRGRAGPRARTAWSVCATRPDDRTVGCRVYYLFWEVGVRKNVTCRTSR